MPEDKKSGTGLDDLKARLGLSSVLSKPAAPKPAPSPPKAPPPAQPPTPEADEAAAREAPAPPREEDYSSAVSTFEEPVLGEGDPRPVYSGRFDAIDPSVKAPVSSTTRWALIGGIAVLVLLGLLFGYMMGAAMRERQVANHVIDAAAEMVSQITPIKERLVAFNEQLSNYSNEYSPQLHEVFTDYYSSDQSVLSVSSISEARVLMTTGEDLARDLLEFSSETRFLASLVEAHRRKTATDQQLIDQVLSGEEDQRGYAVFFRLGDLIEAYNNYIEDPENVQYSPPFGSVVRYEVPLTMCRNGVCGEPEEGQPNEETGNPDEEGGDEEGGEEEESVLWEFPVEDHTGRARVPIHSVLLLSRDQLRANPNEETALTRYSARVQNIRSRLQILLALQEQLLNELEERASQSHQFTF